MATIAQLLTTLDQLRDELAENLTSMGVPSSSTEKLNVLVPRVLQIPQTSVSVNEFTLLDTSTSGSKSDTLNMFSETVYIYESADSTVLSLSDVVDKWGGIDAQNNYIGDASSLYGIMVDNWTRTDCNTGILISSPFSLNTGKVHVTVNASLSDWVNQTINLRLISADDLESAKSKILASDFAYTSTFVFSGNTSLRDHIISIDGISSGTYFFYADGTTTSNSSNFTYNKLKILNY